MPDMGMSKVRGATFKNNLEPCWRTDFSVRKTSDMARAVRVRPMAGGGREILGKFFEKDIFDFF